MLCVLVVFVLVEEEGTTAEEHDDTEGLVWGSLTRSLLGLLLLLVFVV